MRLIDPHWSGLAEGYQTVQTLQGKLEAEFGRAVQVSQHRRFQRELSDWQRKRRMLIALAVLAPLALATLCVAAFFLKEMACVIVYWVFVVAVILVALAVAGRQYIQQAAGRQPEPDQAASGVTGLEDLWWQALGPAIPPPAPRHAPPSFLARAAAVLTNETLALAPGPGAEPAGLLLVCACGIWLFQVRSWEGRIGKTAEGWLITSKGGRKKGLPAQPPDPDGRWIEDRKLLEACLTDILPELPGAAGLIQGGVIFSHPRAAPDRAAIQDSRCSYGSARAWLARLRDTPAVEAFPVAMRLKVLEAASGALAGEGGAVQERRAASGEAERLYQEVVERLRQSIADELS